MDKNMAQEHLHLESAEAVDAESAPVEKHHEQILDLMMVDGDRVREARGFDIADLPRKYWYSKEFLGSFFAVLFGSLGGISGFNLVAPLLGRINADLGPSASIAWYATAWVLCQGIGNLVGGRLSDVFGRRWVFITGAILCVLGSIIALTAKSVGQIVGAGVLLGFGAGTQLSFFWTIAELVPMRYRYIAGAFPYIMSWPAVAMGAKLAYIFSLSSVGWRGAFYFCLGANINSVMFWYLFYRPATLKMLHKRQAFMDLAKSFDWIGLCLYAGSNWTFLMGIGWGGSAYPWKSAHVIGSILAGAAGFALLLLWCGLCPIKGTIPFIPLKMLRNGPLMIVTVVSSVGGSVFYGSQVIWPNAVTVIYSEGRNHSTIGTLYSIVTIGYTGGLICGNFAAFYVGNKYGIIGSLLIGTPLVAASGADLLNFSLTAGLVVTGVFFIGMSEGIALTDCSFPLETQEEIGTAGGVCGTLRLLISNTAITVFSSTLSNRLTTTIPSNVIPAATHAGLSSSAIPSLISGLQGLTPLTSQHIPGLTPEITAAASVAWQTAYAQALKTVFLVTLAVSGPGLVCSFFLEQDDKKKFDFVAQHIHDGAETKKLEADDEPL